jgi:hypothetical protein
MTGGALGDWAGVMGGLAAHHPSPQATSSKRHSDGTEESALALLLALNSCIRVGVYLFGAQKPRIVPLFNVFCNVGKGQNNKFKYKPYFASSP